MASIKEIRNLGLQGLELAEEAASGHGVGGGGGEEGSAGIEEVDLEGEEGRTEGVDVRAVVDNEDEGVATKDPDEGILHELQVGFDGWRVHGLKFYWLNKRVNVIVFYSLPPSGYSP